MGPGRTPARSPSSSERYARPTFEGSVWDRQPGFLSWRRSRAAGVRLTPAQLKLGADAAAAEGRAQIDAQAVYADWLRAATQRKDRLHNPAGHWIDYCKRRAQQEKEGAG